MHAQRIHVLDGTDNHHVVLAVAHQLQLEFLPSEDGFFDEHVGLGRSSQSATGDAFQVGVVVRKARTQATHGEGRADHHGKTQFSNGGAYLIHVVADGRTGRGTADLGHDVLELLAILTALNGIDVRTNQLHTVFVQDAEAVQLDGCVQRGLSTQGCQHGIHLVASGFFSGKDLLDVLRLDGLNVGVISELRVRHDGGGVGVDEGDAQSLLLEHAAGLGAGVIELTGLADDDGAGTDHEYVLDVFTTWH